MKLWAGRLGEADEKTNDFNSSISFDSRMVNQDIEGSLAHAAMLAACGIIEQRQADEIAAGLRSVLVDIESGALAIDPAAEDIHTFIEGELTARIGDAGKRLHTARSRNDQVALDLRLYLREESRELRAKLTQLLEVFADKAEETADAVMPGYTHLQRAQPVTFGHHMLCYAEMLLRDLARLADCEKRMNVSPLGAGALAGTTYPIDRAMTAQLLHMDSAAANSMDAVSDRDFAIEFTSALSILMVHLSRLSEEIILWCSWEFRFIELNDRFSTGSSIMPQKKNPDIAELIRGKAGRVFGDLQTLLCVMKGLPLAYNKDMQEDKEAVFDALDTVNLCLVPLIPMLATMKINRENLRMAAAKGFINAADAADYLVKKGLPFRDAYKIMGVLVARCIEREKTLETLPLTEYREQCELFEEDVFEAIKLEHILNARTSYGGPAPACVREQIGRLRENIRELRSNET